MSEEGNVGSWVRLQGKDIEYQVQTNNCWHCTSHPPRDRGYYALWDNGKPVKMHRYVFERTFGPIPKDMKVLHTCDNNLCINPEHLFLGTMQDNSDDMKRKHRSPKMHGENAPNHRLTTRQALAIRESMEDQGILAKRYKVSKVTVDFIQRCRLWKNYMTSGVIE